MKSYFKEKCFGSDITDLPNDRPGRHVINKIITESGVKSLREVGRIQLKREMT